MKEHLDAYAKHKNVNIIYSVDKSVTPNWTGFTGYVSEDKVKQSMPQN
jgi:NAD(P)H-flavin reductase